VREDVTFGAGNAAWFYPGGPACVVMAHGFGGTRTARLDAFAERFQAAGHSALVFDYLGFGASPGEPRQVVDIKAQLDQYRAAIAHARALDGVERIVVWGTSFSGGHVMVLAAEDPQIAAAISQGAFADGLATLAGFGVRNSLLLTWHGLRDQLGALAGRPPHTIPIVGPPGTVATMNTPDAEPGYKALVDGDWINASAARVGLRVATYRPGTKASGIACPWLVVVADRDTITPPGALLKAAARAPRAEVRRHDCRHFDIYVGDVFEANVADQVAFLERVLK
jgi:uncharacterized protein